MIRGFYTAKSALNAHQEHMNTIANNLANVNTIGFKPHRTAFTDLIYQNLNREEVENPIEIGHGVKVNKNDVHMAQGALEPTNFPLDFAIISGENGYFASVDELGQVYYTRAGDFRLSLEGDTYYLVTGNGEKVLNVNGEVIDIEFDEAGDMIFSPAEIAVFTFRNHYGLALSGLNRFVPTEMSGEAEIMENLVELNELLPEGETAENPNLKRGYIERSGVEVAKEMADVIEASKAFSFASRMVQVADEVKQTVNSLR